MRLNRKTWQIATLLGVLFCAIVGGHSSAQALDSRLGWAEKTSDCKTFLKKTEQFVSSLPDMNTASDIDRNAVDEILQMACSQRFARCKFSICGDDEAAEVVSQAEESLDDMDVVDEVSDPDEGDKATNKKVDKVERNDENIGRQTVRGLETNGRLPLWLTQPWSCDELSEQFQAQYAPFGSFNEFPPFIVEQFTLALKESCQVRFSHCSFVHCLSPQAITGADRERLVFKISGLTAYDAASFIAGDEFMPKTGPVEVKQQPEVKSTLKNVFWGLSREDARGRLATLLNQYREEFSANLDIVSEKEVRGKVQWLRFTVPIERKLPDPTEDNKPRERVWYTVKD
ncbi:MAG: hypothetical protein PHC51_04940 [bacterium]|nr:hypothetical protein [bacterium]